MIMRIIAALFLMTFLATIPLSGSAQTIPSYAQPEVGGDAQIRGRIASFDNAYNLKVRDEKRYVDNVGSVYHGGSFHGRDYVARRVQGGYYLRGAHGISHH